MFKLGFRGKMAVGLLGLALGSFTYAANIDIEDLMQEAKSKVAEGDLESAAVLYHRVLEIESRHPEARRALAQVIINAGIKEPYAEETDALNALIPKSQQDER